MVTINGKQYELAKYTYNTSCELEEMGADVNVLLTKPNTLVRAYLAISGGMSPMQAGEEIEQHYMNGGNMDEFVKEMLGEVKNSGFFQTRMKQLTKEEETEEALVPTVKKRRSTKKNA